MYKNFQNDLLLIRNLQNSKCNEAFLPHFCISMKNNPGLIGIPCHFAFFNLI